MRRTIHSQLVYVCLLKFFAITLGHIIFMAPLFTKLKHSQNKSSTFHRCVFLPGKQCILQNVLQDVDCVMCWEKSPSNSVWSKKSFKKKYYS